VVSVAESEGPLPASSLTELSVDVSGTSVFGDVPTVEAAVGSVIGAPVVGGAEVVGAMIGSVGVVVVVVVGAADDAVAA
jgi:hypothetical protein